MANPVSAVERQVYHQAEVVQLVGTSRASLLRMERRGILHPVRVHGRPLYVKAEVHRVFGLQEGSRT